jgi:MFS family permease
MMQVLICAALIVTLSMGIRHGFGLWLQPITQERGWSRETFAFALAVQNLAWGLAGPIAGAIADRWGAFKVLTVGAFLYALGLVLMALSTSGSGFLLSTGVLMGIAQSATTFAVVYGVIGRQVEPSQRSWAMGITAAAGSFGQFLMVPLENWLMSHWGWQNALFILAATVLLIAPFGRGLKEPLRVASSLEDQNMGQALKEAINYPSFRWLMAGYFVCGFQVVFIGVHLPSYLKDHGLSPQVATTALALIGLFNVIGTYVAGTLGQQLPKKHILATIYALRSVAILIFLALPLTPWSVYIFASVMGVLWLSTVPPTNAMVAQIFGVRYFSMLGGFVFLSHQLGSFLGVWLGGLVYDQMGNYNLVWGMTIVLGLLAALTNLPIKEIPILRTIKKEVLA